MSGLPKESFFPSVASTSHEGQEEDPSLSSNKRLRVTLLSSEWGSSKGGVSTINRELAVQLAKHPNVEVSVYLPQCSEEDKKVARSHDVQLIEAGKLPGLEPVFWLASVPKDHAMDFVIGHGVHLGKQVPLIKQQHVCKWIQVVHTAPEELGMYKCYTDAISKGEKKYQMEKELCESADQVVAVGPKLTDAFSRYLRSSEKDQNVLNLTPGIFTEFSEVKQATEERETFCVLVFGRGDNEDFKLKGYDIAAQAVAELNEKAEKCYKLLFVGAPEGKADEVTDKLVQCGISRDQLTVRCFNEKREWLAKLLCEVDLAIMPSRTEGFGLTALEALSAGLPILVSGNSGLGEALKKVCHGYHHVVDSEDPKAWAKAISIAHQKDREVRLEEAHSLREVYAVKYSWEKQCNCLVEKMLHLTFESASSDESSRVITETRCTGGTSMNKKEPTKIPYKASVCIQTECRYHNCKNEHNGNPYQPLIERYDETVESTSDDPSRLPCRDGKRQSECSYNESECTGYKEMYRSLSHISSDVSSQSSASSFSDTSSDVSSQISAEYPICKDRREPTVVNLTQCTGPIVFDQRANIAKHEYVQPRDDNHLDLPSSSTAQASMPSDPSPYEVVDAVTDAEISDENVTQVGENYTGTYCPVNLQQYGKKEPKWHARPGGGTRLNQGSLEFQWSIKTFFENPEKFIQEMDINVCLSKEEKEDFILHKILPHLEKSWGKCFWSNVGNYEILAKISCSVKSGKVVRQALQLLLYLICKDNFDSCDQNLLSVEAITRSFILSPDGLLKNDTHSELELKLHVYSRILSSLVIQQVQHGELLIVTRKQDLKKLQDELQKFSEKLKNQKKNRFRYSMEFILKAISCLSKPHDKLKGFLDECQEFCLNQAINSNELKVIRKLKKSGKLGEWIYLHCILIHLHGKVHSERPKPQMETERRAMTLLGLLVETYLEGGGGDDWRFCLLAASILSDIAMNSATKEMRQEAGGCLLNLLKDAKVQKKPECRACLVRRSSEVLFCPDRVTKLVDFLFKNQNSQHELPADLYIEHLSSKYRTQMLEINKKTISQSSSCFVNDGMFQRRKVAVKVLFVKNEHLLEEDRIFHAKERLIREAYNLRRLTWLNQSHHPNIPVLLSYDTKSLPYHLITAFERWGDLLQFVRRSRKKSPHLQPIQLLMMLIDIADALLYLEKKGLVHRAVMATNVLVGDNYVCKLGGMYSVQPLTNQTEYSDSLYSYCSAIDGCPEFINKANDEELPVRWKAPECLLEQRYSTASDVWAFGVLMYEVLTYGCFPYRRVSNNDEVVKRVMNTDRKVGLLFREPCFKEKEYELMKQCCEFHRHSRPKLSEVKAKLREMHKNADEDQSRPDPPPLDMHVTYESSDLENSEDTYSYIPDTYEDSEELYENLPCSQAIEEEQDTYDDCKYHYDLLPGSQSIEKQDTYKDMGHLYENLPYLQSIEEEQDTYEDSEELYEELPGSQSIEKEQDTYKDMGHLYENLPYLQSIEEEQGLNNEWKSLFSKVMVELKEKHRANALFTIDHRGDLPRRQMVQGVSVVSEKITKGDVQHLRRLLTLKHPNLVSIWKIDDLDSHCPTVEVISKEAPLGNVKEYVLNRRCQIGDIVTYLSQVASALNYLHEKHIVHGDLSAKYVNVLAPDKVQVGHLGRSKPLSMNYYEVNSSSCVVKATMPPDSIRRSAPEVILDGHYTHASDVWAFGILAWELYKSFSTGQDGRKLSVPFYDLDNREILPRIRDIGPLPQPDSCPDWMYIIMHHCWTYDSRQRPPFLAIFDCLTSREPMKSWIMTLWLRNHDKSEWPDLSISQTEGASHVTDTEQHPKKECIEKMCSEDFFAKHEYTYVSITSVIAGTKAGNSEVNENLDSSSECQSACISSNEVQGYTTRL